MQPTVYTIGHSTHSFEQFITLLKQHGITALCDVRSKPYSRMSPQFNRESLKQSLQEKGIIYVFLGQELGARSENPACYVRGKVQFDRMAQSALFQKGIDRVKEGMKNFRVALMCAEKDPLACHRTILVSRHVEAAGIKVEHILADGTIASHADILCRLLFQLHLEQDLLRSYEDVVDEAYRIQGERIAYDEGESSSEGSETVGSINR